MSTQSAIIVQRLRNCGSIRRDDGVSCRDAGAGPVLCLIVEDLQAALEQFREI